MTRHERIDHEPVDPAAGARHPDDDALQDLVDGRLPAPARAAADAHLAACAACTARVRRLRRLLALAAGLPRELAPPRDGWPALRLTLAARAARPALGASGSRLAAVLAAVALLIAAIVSWDAWRDAARMPDGASIASDRVAAATPSADDTLTVGGAGFPGVERDYAHAAAELAAQLAATRSQLRPDVAASVDRSLATIDSALAEARAALRADPSDPELARYVVASYEQKLDLLRRSTVISSGD
ncbi:MAG TPA: zf-HC2 domain-containing protein [Gemmatimonadaceae bacterium]